MATETRPRVTPLANAFAKAFPYCAIVLATIAILPERASSQEAVKPTVLASAQQPPKLVPAPAFF
jgi:hypothetical protein